MYLISNKQLADCVRFTRIMIETMLARDTRAMNVRRVAGKLLKQLKAKQPLSEVELFEVMSSYKRRK